MLLLASASPARRRLLEQAAISHRVQVSGVDEDAITDLNPAQLVQWLARAKALAVWNGCTEPDITAVLGCDSVLAFEGEVFGKPADAEEAIARWRRMAGGWGELHTGHCLLPVVGAAQVLERFDANGVATGEPLQCAGGFALEGRGGLVVERIEGCFSNVIGLSLPLLRRWLAGDGSGG